MAKTAKLVMEPTRPRKIRNLRLDLTDYEVRLLSTVLGKIAGGNQEAREACRAISKELAVALKEAGHPSPYNLVSMTGILDVGE